MPGPDQLIRAAVGLPWAIARRVIGLGHGLLPGTGGNTAEHEPERAARAPAPTRSDAVEAVELVAESADPEATEPPGPQLHVDEPWEGYRRQKVTEITAQLEGQPAEVLAAVELYEMTHRKRQGVLDAVRSATRG